LEKIKAERIFGKIMYEHKLVKEIRCPLEYGLSVFGGKWKSRILCVLSSYSSVRYSDLREQMVNVSDTSLALALKELIRDELVERRQFNEVPMRVEYSLTDKGRSVIPLLRAICRWSGAYHKEMSDRAPEKCRNCDYLSSPGAGDPDF
jgi:DNA-binding HxlR family transcriptional regulator